MARIQDAATRPLQDALSAGLLSFGDQMAVCLGAAQGGGDPARRGWLRHWLRRLASLGRALVRRDAAAGLSERHLKDIGVPPPRLAAGSPSVDAVTRLSIRANGGF